MSWKNIGIELIYIPTYFFKVLCMVFQVFTRGSDVESVLAYLKTERKLYV